MLNADQAERDRLPGEYCKAWRAINTMWPRQSSVRRRIDRAVALNEGARDD